MSEWVEKRIGDFIERHWSGEWGVELTASIPAARVYRSTEIDDEGHLATEGGVFRSISSSQDFKAIRNGDILVEASGGAPNRPVGRIALADFETAERRFTSNFVRTLRPKGEIDSGFLAWKLHWLNKQPDIWRHQQQTTGIINLKIDSYLNQKISAPLDGVEQSKIAEILSLIDTQIEATQALVAKQQQVRAGLMQDLFTRGIDRHGQLRPAREEAPHLYHQTELGWLPRQWEVSGLRSKGPINGKHLKTGPFGSSLKIEHWVSQGRPVITIGSLGEGIFKHDELLYVSDETAARLEAYQLYPGDVVFSRVADVGRSVVIEPDNSGWIMSSNLMRIRLDARRVRPHYLHLQLAFDSALRAQIRRSINSGGRDVANAAVLNSLKFVWPTPEEQDLIIEAATKLNAESWLFMEDLRKLRIQKSGLMQDLLTGKVSITSLLEGVAA